MHHGVARDQIAERFVLLLGRQLAIEQQIAGLHEGAALGELIDGVAAIKQHALFAVDEGDLRLAARGGGETRIVSEEAGLGVERGDVDHVRAERALADRQLVALPGDHQGRVGRRGLADIAFCDAHESLLKPLCDEMNPTPTAAHSASSSGFGVVKFLHCGIDATNVTRCNKGCAQRLSRFAVQDLIADARERFLAAKHLEHIENTR